MHRLLASALLLPPLACAHRPEVPASPPAPEGALCWRPLLDAAFPQGFPTEGHTLKLAAGEGGHPWLVWSEEVYDEVDGRPRKETHLRRWDGKSWETVALPEGVDPGWGPHLRTREDGTAFLAFESDDGLHVLQRLGGRWSFLGKVPDSGSDTGADVGDSDLALAPDGQVWVAWTSRRADALRVARWTGTAWERMGDPFSAERGTRTEDPVLAISRDGSPWMAWRTAHTQRSALHAARWDGSRWVGEVAYTRERVDPSDWGPRRPRLAARSGGRALLAWYDQGNDGASVGWRQWTGNRWEEGPALLTPPRGGPRLEEQQPGFPDLVLGADETPFIAWTQADATRIDTVYVQRLTDTGWRWALHGLHMDPGQSDTETVLLGTGLDGTLLVAWSELNWRIGEQGWVIAAAPCAAGEQPRPFPPSRPLESFWPKTVDAAVESVLGTLDEKSKADLRATPRDNLIDFHHGLGTGIRNALGLWRGNTELLKSCGGEAAHPEPCSRVIIERVWERLRE